MKKTTAVLETPEVSEALNANFDAGVAEERRNTLIRLTPNGTNFEEAYCKAFFEAGVDADGVLWLSVLMQGQPAHVTTLISRMFRNSRKFQVSQMSPYRVTRRGV